MLSTFIWPVKLTTCVTLNVIDNIKYRYKLPLASLQMRLYLCRFSSQVGASRQFVVNYAEIVCSIPGVGMLKFTKQIMLSVTKHDVHFGLAVTQADHL